MKNLISFTLGVAVGALITWTYHKNKYEEMVQEEVESLREHSKKKVDKNDSIDDSSDVEFNEDEKIELVDDARNIIDYCHYSDKENTDDNSLKINEKPFIVTPEEFASMVGFDTDTFYYHNDDVIANCDGQIVEDVESILGMTTEDIKNQFGVYDDNSVFIRNMQLECDYEVLLDEENFYKEE